MGIIFESQKVGTSTLYKVVNKVTPVAAPRTARGKELKIHASLMCSDSRMEE